LGGADRNLPTGRARIGHSVLVSSGSRASDDEWPAGAGLDVGQMFALERGRLLSLLSGLAPADWGLPTPCPGWNVLDLSSHLLGDDLGWLARHRDDRLGTPSPARDEEGFVEWLDALQDDWVQAARRLSPRLVVDLLGWTLPQVVETLARVDPSAVTASVSWAGPGPVPVWLDQLRELSERWIHRQQLLQALGRPSDLRADIAGPVLDGLRWAYPYRLATATTGDGDSVDITIAGPVSRTWTLVAAGGGWHFAGRPGGPPTAAVRMTTEQAWRLLTNNLPEAEQDAIVMTGDPTLVGLIRRTRAIIGLPK